VEEPPGTASSEPEIISESFFLLTSSSFSNDLSRGRMPTDYKRMNSILLTTQQQNQISKHASSLNCQTFTFAIAANAEKAASLTSGVPSFRHCKIQIIRVCKVTDKNTCNLLCFNRYKIEEK
jgi:hypothetical protein